MDRLHHDREAWLADFEFFAPDGERQPCLHCGAEILLEPIGSSVRSRNARSATFPNRRKHSVRGVLHEY